MVRLRCGRKSPARMAARLASWNMLFLSPEPARCALPGVFAAVVMEEPSRMGQSKRRDEALEMSDALGRRKRGVRPTHVGFDPAWIDEDACDRARNKVDRGAAHGHVHG